MELHGSAVLSRRQRRRLVGLVAGGVTVTAAAVMVGCSRQTGSKWVNRARRGEGLEDRSSRPHRSPRRVSETVEQAVLRARSELREGPHVIGKSDRFNDLGTVYLEPTSQFWSEVSWWRSWYASC